MDSPTVLWIDLRRRRTDTDLASSLVASCHIRRLFRIVDLPQQIRRNPPHILCFDLDFPGAGELWLVESTKRSFPSLPILLLTEEHSEALFVWALRSRIWDCLVKPVATDELLERVHKLAALLNLPPNRKRIAVVPGASPRPWDTPVVRTAPERVLLPAISYVEQHFAEPVRLRTVARLCGRSDSEFSRLFHRVYGTTFRSYLLHLRLRKARDLLSIPGVTVNDVGTQVGFRDASYFARVFRRETGQTPSRFRAGATRSAAAMGSQANDPAPGKQPPTT